MGVGLVLTTMMMKSSMMTRKKRKRRMVTWMYYQSSQMILQKISILRTNNSRNCWKKLKLMLVKQRTGIYV
jgi:hypothetical protein